MTQQTNHTLYWLDNVCVLNGPRAEELADKFAFYMRKEQAPNPDKLWVLESRKTKVSLWWNNDPTKPGEVVFPHGLLDLCIDTLKSHGVQYTLLDRRLPMPEPRYDLMRGFRFRQEEKLREMLAKGRSGLGDFPTRWGKTTLLINTMRAFPGVKTVLVAPGTDLLVQTMDDMERQLPGREIKGIFTGCPRVRSGESADITVVSMDSLDKCDPGSTRLILVDEPHAAGAETRAAKLAQFRNARIYGFGATMEGRSDGSDLVFQGLIGPILSQVTYKDAVAHGELCPIKAYIVQVPVRIKQFQRLDQANKAWLYNNKAFAKLVSNIALMLLPQDWQSIVFVDSEAQVNTFMPELPGYEVAMAKLFKNAKLRKELFKKMQSGESMHAIATSIYSQGVTFSNLRAIVNACGGGGSITGKQKPGRLAEVRPGKKYGYLVDFRFLPVNKDGQIPKRVPSTGAAQFFALSKSRIDKYRATGYEVVEVPLLKMGDMFLPDPKIMKFE